MRVGEAGESVGDIRMDITCFNSYLRITFQDPNLQPVPDKDQEEARRISIAIITRMADDTSLTRQEDGTFLANLDFTYDKDFSVQDFLMKHERLD